MLHYFVAYVNIHKLWFNYFRQTILSPQNYVQNSNNAILYSQIYIMNLWSKTYWLISNNIPYVVVKTSIFWEA